MASQKKLDQAYMECAFAIAKLSYAERKKVGAIVVGQNGGIIAEGCNGTPPGFDNCCEYEEYHGDERVLVTKPECLHAERNAIDKIARSTNSSLGSTLYVTMSPCFECSKSIIQSGVKRVVYAEQYRLTDGLALLAKANILVDKLESTVDN